jgi:hypothetical protein
MSADCRAQPTTSEAQVVLDSLKAIDNCYHWAGETGDQNEQRNKEIADGINRDCPVARERARHAYSLYPKNAALSAGLLKLIDVGDLKVTETETKTICETAVPQLQGDFSKSRTEDVLFRAICPGEASRLYGR